MRVVCGLARFTPLPRRPAAAIGNFDGVHLGHRKLLARLRAVAETEGLSSLVLTFHPHPARALGTASPPMIDTLEQRMARIAEAGIDAALVVPFDRRFAGLSAEDFVGKVLVAKLRVRELVVGRDFRFGRDRRGDIAVLRRLGRPAGLDVQAVPPVVRDGRPVSSSAVRHLLRDGRVDAAARLLGRPYEVAGRVVGGSRRGRGLGFPTANMETENEILPDGVFISEAVWKGGCLPSVTSIGTNPTFGPHPVRVETHVLGRRVDLYGHRMTVRLLRRIRPTVKFRSPEALAAAIAGDVAEAAAYFGERD